MRAAAKSSVASPKKKGQKKGGARTEKGNARNPPLDAASPAQDIVDAHRATVDAIEVATNSNTAEGSATDQMQESQPSSNGTGKSNPRSTAGKKSTTLKPPVTMKALEVEAGWL